MEKKLSLNSMIADGWHTYYHPNYWVNKKVVDDPTRQDYTDYGMSLDEAIEWEENGCNKIGMTPLNEMVDCLKKSQL